MPVSNAATGQNRAYPCLTRNRLSKGANRLQKRPIVHECAFWRSARGVRADWRLAAPAQPQSAADKFRDLNHCTGERRRGDCDARRPRWRLRRAKQVKRKSRRGRDCPCDRFGQAGGARLADRKGYHQWAEEQQDPEDAGANSNESLYHKPPFMTPMRSPARLRRASGASPRKSTALARA